MAAKKKAKVVLNKDGTPRKPRSGNPKPAASGRNTPKGELTKQTWEKLERAMRFYVMGKSGRQSALRAGLGTTVEAAGTAWCMYTKRPDVQARLNEIREDLESEELLSLYRIRELRKQIAEDPTQFTKDRLAAMAAECLTMGYNKDKDDRNTATEIHVHIGTPVDPEH